jgi:hypothetical protein
LTWRVLLILLILLVLLTSCDFGSELEQLADEE